MIARLSLVCLLGACGGSSSAECEESPLALVQPPSAIVTAGGESLHVEVADTDEERSRGLQHRRCGVTGLLIVGERPGQPLPIWMCQVAMPLDLAFVRDEIVVHVVDGAAPCAEPCAACPIYGGDVSADAVLETPAGSFPLRVGERLSRE